MTRLAPSLSEPVEIHGRKNLSAKRRLQVLLDGDGKCALCNGKIYGEFEIDHRVPIANGGRDEPENWQAAHPTCHQSKTLGEDVPRIVKARKQSKLSLSVERTVSDRPIRSRGFGQPKRVPASKKRRSR